MAFLERPFATAQLSLKRIQGEFEELVTDGIDPTVVLIHVRRPVPHDLYQVEWGLLHHPDRTKQCVKTRTGWTSPDVTDERTKVLGGWTIPDDHATLPGCERWFYVYGKPNDAARIEVLAKELMHLFFKTGPAFVQKFLLIPEGAFIGSHAGYWFEVVFDFARRSLPSIPLQSFVFPLTDDLQFDFNWDGKPIPDPWSKSDQPPGWAMRVDRFCTASVDVIGLLLNWGATGNPPFEVDFIQTQSRSNSDPFEIEAAKGEKRAAERQSADEELKRRKRFWEAVEAVRNCCYPSDLAKPQKREEIVERLMKLANLCHEFDVPGRLSNIPQNPPGVACGIKIFESALAENPDDVLRMLEKTATFTKETQTTLTKFLPNVGWLLWHDIRPAPGETELNPIWLDDRTFESYAVGATDTLEPDSVDSQFQTEPPTAEFDSATSVDQPTNVGVDQAGNAAKADATTPPETPQNAELLKRVASLEQQQKKPKKSLTPTERIRHQRIKFCCPRRRKKSPETWNEIYDAYSEKYPNDSNASPATLRLSHHRNCERCLGGES